MAVFFGLLQEPPGCTVVVSKYIGILKEFVLGDPGFEFRARNKKVFPSILFIPAWRTGCIGNGKL